ncbi:MAG TPA: metal-dependent hydrolase [Desulfonatronum sp.]|nr:metal-dependent hydrolase [Desulfonatronum sp.]
MPMPLAHCAAGAAAFVAFSPGAFLKQGKARWILLAACLFLANLPDLDFLPGLLMGAPNRYHQGFSHSLFFMFCFATLAFFLLNRYRARQAAEFPARRLLFCLLVAGLSHPILDFFSLDTSAPQGVPLFWPFSPEHYSSPWPLFLNVQRADLPGMAFFASLLSMHNLRGALRELLFGLALLLLVYAARRRGRRAWSASLFGLTLMVALFIIR